MPTSVHIPDRLLKAAEKRAKALGISRNRLIVQALERELNSGSQWPPGFFEQLSQIDDETKQAAQEMAKAIKKNRRSKSPIQF